MKDHTRRVEGRKEGSDEGIEARINTATLKFVENLLAGRASIVVEPIKEGDGIANSVGAVTQVGPFRIRLDPGE